MPGIFPFVQDIFDNPHGMWLLSNSHGCTSSLESTSQLHLPEVWPLAQYLIDMGLRPALARRLSNTYMDSVDRYRKACQSHFNRATHGGHLTEYYPEVFVVLFKRTTQAWGSQIMSFVRVQLYQTGAFRATVRPERVDIRVDDAAKAEIIARLGFKATHLTSDGVVTSPSADVTSHLEEVSEQTHTLSAHAVDSRLMPPGSPVVSSTSKRYDPFSHVAPQTCFPAPYPPPPPASCFPRNRLPTSFISLTPPRDVGSLAKYSPDMSTLTNLFGRMTTMTPETNSKTPRSHGVFDIPESNRIKPLSPILSLSAANSTRSRMASEESIASPTKSTNTSRRRKIASLPTRRGKQSAPPIPPVFDSAEPASYLITPRPTEQVVEVAPPDYVFASPQNTHVSTLPPLYTAEALCVGTPKSPITRQRKVHTLPHKALPQSQMLPQNQALRPLARARKFSYTVSRSPPLVSDATSYFDSPPTSSDELDTPPSTPPRSHVSLSRTSTEGLAISPESDGIVLHKGPLGDAKRPNPKQRHMHLDFTKGGWNRNEQPLTFTFGV